MGQKKYWKGLEELHNTPAHQEIVANEFPAEKVPFADVSESLLAATTPRRDFLKYLGFSTAAAMIAASCEMPVRKVIPYAIKPEDIVPGVPNYYASTFIDGGDYAPIVIKTRDGRPIKVEGNELSSITGGATTARVQASVLSLYDKQRFRGPQMPSAKKEDITDTVETFKPVDDYVQGGLRSGKPTVVLTSTILSPTVKAVIQEFIAKIPGARHVTYDAISYSGMLLANEVSYGKRALPSYHFDRAQTIVSIGADFLGTWLSPAEFSKQHGVRRKISAANPEMSRHYQFEGMHSMTGANADVRATVRPSQYGAVAVALYNAVTTGAAPSFPSKPLNTAITKAAADLKAGNGLVVCGSNNVAIQTVVNGINSAIGAVGTTINWGITSNYKQGIDSDMVDLVAQMEAGQIGTLIMHGVNPVYEYYDSAKFVAALAKVPVSVTTSERLDETAAVVKHVVPDHHFLESWGDAEPKTGYYSLMQPGIAPLFKTRSFADSLLTWAGITSTYGDIWKTWWLQKLGSQSAFDQALQDGVVEPGGGIAAQITNAISTATGQADTLGTQAHTATMAAARPVAMSGASFGGNVAGAIAAIGSMPAPKGFDIVVYEKVSIGRGGAWSNNPWLQEMPDPITKATWDNYACISPKMARKLDDGNQEMELTTQNEVVTKKRVLKVTLGNKSVELPAVVIPGMHEDVVAIAVGYGRSKEVGKAAANLGKNAYPMLRWNDAGRTFEAESTGVSITKTPDHYDVAITQTHHSYEGRAIIREYTLEAFKKDPKALVKEREEEVGHYAHLPWVGHGSHDNGQPDGHGASPDNVSKPGSGFTEHTAGERNRAHGATEFEDGFMKNGTMYPQYDTPGIHWGMSIDLTACIGCGACVIGCQAENNVSVVGKDKVLQSQEMHWITIDRYFSGDPDDADSIQTVFQPMMCQHCDNAPCENVCPVSATNHSSEGLNQMAYNRCIGTKYCANNCPYKVRHFNWLDWNGADCFDDNLYEDGRRDDINDDLTRMVLNPDVTVRSRGVMEKCSFCVQRLQEAKLTAKKEGRPVRDGEARTACQQACPTGGIVFGNVNDVNSEIYKLRHKQQIERTYYVLEEIHTLPNVNYLSKVRNSDGIVAKTDRDILMQKSI